MGKQSPSVAVQKVDRMILVHLLVLVYSLRGCLGVHHSPGAVWESQDTAGHLDLLNKFSGNELVGESSSRGYLPNKHTVIHDVLDSRFNSADHNSNIREFNLKMLLQNLAKLRHLNRIESKLKVSQTARKNEHANSRSQYHLRGQQMRTSPTQINNVYSPDLLSRQTGVIRLTNDQLQRNNWSNFLSVSPGEGRIQSLPSAGTTNAFHRFNDIFYNDLSVHRGPETALGQDIHEGERDFHQRSAHKVKEQPIVHDFTNKKLNIRGGKFFQFAKDKEDTISYLFTPVNYLNGKVDTESMNSNTKTLHAEDASVDKRIDQHGEVWREVNTDERDDDLANGGNTDTVNSLIFKTVKKMEGIAKRRVYQYDTFLTTVQILPDDGSDKTEQDNLSNENNTWPNENKHIAQTDNKDPKEMPSHEAELTDDENGSVIEEVVKAVADRKVPKDIRFWQKLSYYLDSNDYRTRSRRSLGGKRHKGHRYVHLSITYGHVMPCEYKDRYYCMNGGTCVFVGALDIRTCRCPIGYTGVRCELIDQEYILSLLTNTLIFS